MDLTCGASSSSRDWYTYKSKGWRGREGQEGEKGKGDNEYYHYNSNNDNYRLYLS
jgi:hypothetical protein